MLYTPASGNVIDPTNRRRYGYSRGLHNMAKFVLLVQLSLAYSGCVSYLAPVGAGFLYAFYVLMICCAGYCWRYDSRTLRALKYFKPYCAWYIFFSIWTCFAWLFSALPAEALQYLVRDVVRAVMIWGSVIAVLPDREHLRKFAVAISIVALANAIVSWLIPTSPALFAFILRNSDIDQVARYGEIARSTGLWGNANQAAHAFLFAALLSCWAPAMWRYICRGSSFVGIFLSASRQGVYLLVLATAVFCGQKLRAALSTPYIAARRFPVYFLAVAVPGLLLAALLALGRDDGSAVFDFDNLPGFNNIERIFDVTERNATVSRMDVAEKAWAQITDGPIIGSGPYAMRHFLVRFGDDEQDHGAHNIYLSIWGEAGVPMLGLYLAVLWIGARRAFKAPIPAFDKGLLLLMWCDYFLIGFTWHGQLGDFNGLIFSCLLFVLPATLTTSSEADR